MYEQTTNKISSLLALPLLVAVVLTAWGCAAPETRGTNKGQLTPKQVARIPADPRVVEVVAFYDSYNPWVLGVERSKVRGIAISALYLVGPNSKGIFGDGIIRPKLYVTERELDGSRKWVLAKEWSFTVEQAIPLRAKKETMMGWGYGLFLDWGDLDLAGREIRMIILFERNDGHIVPSSKKKFRVPMEG